MLYRKKPIAIEVITFAEFVQYAKENSPHPHWSFDFKGYPVTHENDACYIIPNQGTNFLFTPNDVLIIGVKGEIYACPIDVFEITYEPVKE